MKRKIKWWIPLLCLCLALGGFGVYWFTPPKEPKIMRGSASYIIDIDNPREVVGHADYVFVGYVEKLVETEQWMVNPEQDPTITIPVTHYLVSVLQNIKGNLTQKEPVPIRKHGGYETIAREIYLLEDDELPEVGQHYIFTAIAQEDGSLLIYGANSNVQLEAGMNQARLKDSKIVKEYEDAFSNQVDRRLDKRYASKYAVSADVIPKEQQ